LAHGFPEPAVDAILLPSRLLSREAAVPDEVRRETPVEAVVRGEVDQEMPVEAAEFGLLAHAM
jgi:hypothetical protein